jgi:murein endopeptidase
MHDGTVGALLRLLGRPYEMPMRVTLFGVTAALAAFVISADTLHAAPPLGVTAATTPPSSQWVVHEVIPGEGLEEVATRYAVSTTSILRWNRLDPKRVRDYTGLRLRIQTQLPQRQRDKLSYVVRPSDTWARIADRYAVDPQLLANVWNASISRPRPGDRLLIWVEPGVMPKEEPTERGLIEDMVVPVEQGAVSFGHPNAGRLLNGVMIPENPSLYTIRNVLHSWGSSHAIEMLQRGLAAFRIRTKYEGEILLWDMGLKRGGGFGPHKSHKSGRDVDIAIPVKKGLPPETPNRNDAIDWPATWQLVRALIETGEVKYVFLARPRQAELYKAALADGATPEQLDLVMQYPRRTKHGIVRHSPGHHCHLHVRFGCGPNEPDCVD